METIDERRWAELFELDPQGSDAKTWLARWAFPQTVAGYYNDPDAPPEWRTHTSFGVRLRAEHERRWAEAQSVDAFQRACESVEAAGRELAETLDGIRPRKGYGEPHGLGSLLPLAPDIVLKLPAPSKLGPDDYIFREGTVDAWTPVVDYEAGPVQVVHLICTQQGYNGVARLVETPEETELDRFKREFLEAVAGKEPGSVRAQDAVGEMHDDGMDFLFHEFYWYRFGCGWFGHPDCGDGGDTYRINGYDLGRSLRAEAERRWAEHKKQATPETLEELVTRGAVKVTGVPVILTMPSYQGTFTLGPEPQPADRISTTVAAMMARPFGEAEPDVKLTGYPWPVDDRGYEITDHRIDHDVRNQYIRARLAEREAERTRVESAAIWGPYDHDD